MLQFYHHKKINDLLTKLKVLIIIGKYISEYNEGNEFIIHLLEIYLLSIFFLMKVKDGTTPHN